MGSFEHQDVSPEVPSTSAPEAFHIVQIDLERLHGWHIELFLLHEAMLDVGFARRSEDGPIVWNTCAHLRRGRRGSDRNGCRSFLELLHMQHGDATGMALENLHRVTAANPDPAAVQFD